MKPIYAILMAGALVLFAGQNAEAQFWNKVKSHAADVVNQTVDKAIEGKEDKQESSPSPQEKDGKLLSIANPFDFTPGNRVIFSDNFASDTIGHFPQNWKTNASGSVVAVPGTSGNWFLLNSDATYKLDSLLSMPENFTVEFDILATANESGDLSPVSFGFTRDNSVSGYLQGVGLAGASLNYYNDDEYYTASRDIDNHHFGTFNLVNTLNTPLHISISVKGTHMKMYLAKTRILDAEMFQPGSRKYFFISAPLNYKHGAKVLIGNVRIAAL